jgi:hypothetical protein
MVGISHGWIWADDSVPGCLFIDIDVSVFMYRQFYFMYHIVFVYNKIN